MGDRSGGPRVRRLAATGGRRPVTRSPARGAARGDRGVVTAESAVVAPVVVVMLAAVLGAGRVAVDQVRCVDAARAAARALARHEQPAVASALATRTAPPGATVVAAESGGMVTVTVRARSPLLLPGRPAVSVGASAGVRAEPSRAAP